MKNSLIDIRNLKKEELELFFTKNNSPKFRASQVWDWIWKHRISDFEKMSNLSVNERELLKNSFIFNKTHILRQETSVDGTVKFLFQLHDHEVVEGVLIPQLNRLTACISSQVGCSLSCSFCATGKLKLSRNLTSGEIYDQAFLINQFCIQKFKKIITNVVFMGMGEPLLNIKNVLKSITHISSSQGMGMSTKRITLSTVGIPKIIKKIADINPKINLAISLHAANNIKRTNIMPINQTNDLNKLLESLIYFYNKTKIKPTYEYVLLNGVNDSITDAKALVSFCKKNPSKVNLIEYNVVKGIPHEKSTHKNTIRFIEFLEKNNVLVKLRKSRGEDIGAACGQLATQIKE